MDEMMKQLLLWANETKDFLSAELPLVAQEFLTWGFYEGLFSILWMSALIYGCYRIFNYCRSDKHLDDDTSCFIGIASLIVGILCIVGIINNTKDCIKIKTAPRLYIIEQLAHKWGK